MSSENSEFQKLQEMSNGLYRHLKKNKFKGISLNHVPSRLFTKHPYANVAIRQFYRISPIDFRNASNKLEFGDDPQSLIFIFRALNLAGKEEDIKTNINRLLNLQSNKTKNFAIKQNQELHLKLYHNDTEDPSPLLTTWFGEYLLEDSCTIFSELEKREFLKSICEYIVSELGYRAHEDKGVYFYYGPTIKKEIYNASAIMSSFLIRAGVFLEEKNIINMGERGLEYILFRQNEDGSWFSNEDKEKSYIDNFHSIFIINALFECQELTNLPLSKAIKNGIQYLRSNLIYYKNEKLEIRHFDPRYFPKNSTCIQKTDARDLATALILFSKFAYDQRILKDLISIIYETFYNKKEGYFYTEDTWLWKNKISYIEMQAWMFFGITSAQQILKDLQNE